MAKIGRIRLVYHYLSESAVWMAKISRIRLVYHYLSESAVWMAKLAEFGQFTTSSLIYLPFKRPIPVVRGEFFMMGRRGSPKFFLYLIISCIFFWLASFASINTYRIDVWKILIAFKFILSSRASYKRSLVFMKVHYRTCILSKITQYKNQFTHLQC